MHKVKLLDLLKEKVNKEKLLEFLKNKIGIAVMSGVCSGIICFIVGAAVFSDSATLIKLKEEVRQCKYDMVNKNMTIKDYKAELETKETLIKELQAKLDEAAPWFNMTEEARNVEEIKFTEEQAKIEAEEEARQDAERAAKWQAKKEADALALMKGVDTEAVKKTVNSMIKKELDEQLDDTILDSLRVNEHSGTDSNEDVIVLMDLTFSRKNWEETTKEMVKIYSDHLAATLAPELADDSEIVLFWDAEFTGLTIKHSYSVENGKAYVEDTSYLSPKE